jgi:hypothetical protein
LGQYIEATYHIGDPSMVAQRKRLLDEAGGIFPARPRQKSTLFQWLAVPLWVPTNKHSVPTDFGGIPFTIFAVAKPLTQSLRGRRGKKAAHTASHSARTPSERVTRRHRLALQTIENRVRHSERIGQFMN